MTRLFLRFFIGVLLILTAAWLLQTWLYGKRLEPMYGEVIRDVYFGGVRIARQKYKLGQFLQQQARSSGDPRLQRDYDAVERLFSEIKDEYDFPVRLHDVEPGWRFGERDDGIHLCRGIDHALGEGTFIMARIVEGEPEILLFGPLPKFGGPPTFEVLMGLGAVLALTSVAIALLLRPVVKQFQVVETTAEQIASGDLSARVDAGRGVNSSKLVRAFNKMASRAESMVRSQEELLQSVSHELRTPLSRIHFATDLIRTANDEQRESKLQAVESAADDLDKIVGELLTYARAENPPGRTPVNLELASILTDVFEKHRLLFPDTQFQLDDSVRSMMIVADTDNFERVMTNLVANAARFSTGVVRVSAVAADNRVAIAVDDDGPGVSEADRDRIFEPFVRVENSGAGVGLGLAIVRRIVENQGGTVQAQNSPLGGCRMRSTWPSVNPSPR